MLTTLSLVACLASSPHKCRDFKFVFHDLPVPTCYLKAQTILPTLMADNPAYVIKSFKCKSNAAEVDM